MRVPSPGLVIFDCDGVLIDSETLSGRSDADSLTAAGFPTTADFIHERFTGMTDRETWAAIEAHHGRALPEGFYEGVIASRNALFARELKAIAGITEALQALAEVGVPFCVASSSHHDRLRRTLGLTGLLPRVEGRIFSAQDVTRGKPAPDIFLHAANTMGMSPADCLVIEDSVHGVMAGAAAGMTVWGFLGGGHIRDGHDGRLTAAGAHRLYRDHAELPSLIGLR